jgi:hypothetical protein
MDSEEQMQQVKDLDIYKTDFLKVVRGQKSSGWVSLRETSSGY